MNPIEVMKQALEEWNIGRFSTQREANAKENLKSAIAEMERAEPVAMLHHCKGEQDWTTLGGRKGGGCFNSEPLYLHPQDRDSIIEECAEVCEKLKSNWNYCADAIRSLKGKK